MPPRLPLSQLRLTRLAESAPSPPCRRRASTYPSLPRRFLSTTLFLGSGVMLIGWYYDSRSVLHEHVVMPLLRLAADPEQGHKAAVRMLSLPKWMRPRDRGVDGGELSAEVFGLPLNNPIGIAAGFDKHAEAIDGLFDLGFGYVEVGSVTPEPQPGNPKPRFFRLEEDRAAINRYGFNSLGHGHALACLRSRLVLFSQSNPSHFPSPLPANPLPPPELPRSLRPGHILAVNLGKNKTSPASSNDDYIRGVRTLGPYADVVVINVSSPNTPGLRALQGREMLERLLTDVVGERELIKDSRGLPRIAVKVACDLSEEELGDVAAAVRQSGVEGVIVSNTTIRRDDLGLRSRNQDQTGGLSGKPLFPLALLAIRTLRPLLPPSIPILACGGITTGSDALAMAEAGASMVQLYTSFGYRGVGTPRLLKDEISTLLGGSSWRDRIGNYWQGKEMGWDEGRLKKGSEALKREARGLGELLRRLDREDETRRLVKEAEAALGQACASRGGNEGPRDNLLGSPGQEENVPAEEVREGHLLEAAGGEQGPEPLPGRGTREIGAPTHEDREVAAEGIGEILIMPLPEEGRVQRVILVPEAEEEDGTEDSFRREVQGGQIRLV